jgi:carboxyl-terminal processing protease
VYGGGGITPDEKYETPKPDALQVATLRKNAFFNFTAYYFSNHPTKLPQGWGPDEAVLEQLHDYLMKNGIQFSESEWAKDHSWMRDQLRAEMYVTAFSFEDSQRVGVEQDPEIQKAIEAMPKAITLLAQSKAHFEKQRASIH